MSNKIKILLMDDNQEIIDGLKSYLGQKQYRVVTATDGLEGLKIIR